MLVSIHQLTKGDECGAITGFGLRSWILNSMLCYLHDTQFFRMDLLMTPAKKAKSCGLTGMAEMSSLCNKAQSTLADWFNNNPELFDVVLSGCVVKKTSETLTPSHVKDKEIE